MYSYKEPRAKPLFDRATKMWLLFVLFSLFGVIGYGIYLYYKSSQFSQELESLKTTNNSLTSEVAKLEKELKILQMQDILVKEVDRSNKLLNNSIKNLFNLVPDQIVLTKVFMKKDTLRLEGLTSTKDAYRLLLEPPLKSIFEDSKVNFEFNSVIGKYKFISINKAETKAKGLSDELSK